MQRPCNTDSTQTALFTSMRWPRAKTPKRADMLAFVEAAIPWGKLEEITRPLYQSDIRKTGRKGYSLRMLLKCYVLQLLWAMSDRQTEAELLDSHAMSRFIGSDPWEPRPPSASVLRQFRILVHGTDWPRPSLYIRQVVADALHEAGVEFRRGEITDPVFRRITKSQGPEA